MFLLILLSLTMQSGMVPVTGRVVDAVTGTALPRVLLVVEGSGAFTMTDQDGRFEIRAPRGRVRLFVSVVGYALTRRDIEVGADPLDLTIPLSEGTGTYVEAVTVSSDRFARTEAAVGAQHVLGSADLQNLRGVFADDPLRAVQALPGVVAGDDLRSEFSVRGSPFSHINMTVEGFATPYILHTVRAVEDYSGSGSVSMINSDILQDVVLLSGAYPQRFGNRTGAEIDFRLREGSRDRTHARVAVSGTNASAVVEGPLGSARRGSWIVSARQSYLDLIIRQIDQGVQFGFTDTQAKMSYDLSGGQRVELALVAGRSRFLERNEEDGGVEETFTGRNASAIAIAGWHITRPRLTLALRALASNNNFSNTAEDDVRIDDGHDRQTGARLDVVTAWPRGVHIEGGADTERLGEHRMRQRFTRGRYRPINDFTSHATRSGAYAQVRLDTNRLTLVPGVRTDHSSLTNETTVSPWVHTQLRLPRSLTVRAGGGLYHQFPAFEQVIGALAAPTSRAQSAVQFDAGVEQRIGDAVRWQVTIYNRDESSFFRRPAAETRLVNDRVVTGSRSAPFSQTLDGFARGLEVLLQRKAAAGLSGWVSYAYGRNRYRDTANDEVFYGDLDQRHTFNIYGFYRKSDRVSFGLKARVGSNVPAPGYYREVDGVVVLSALRNEVRLPVYSRVDLRANRTFNWARSRLTLFAEVMNVLNRDNVRFNPPSVNTQTRQARRMFEQMIPILPSVGVLIEF